jgi:4-hydroxybenzoate polyprenyltransferase
MEAHLPPALHGFDLLPAADWSVHVRRLPAAGVLGRPRWWQWPTVLSLDAPAVAVLWQWLLARLVHAALGWPHVFVLASSVWLVYAGDRWGEGWRLAPEQISTHRHTFYRWRRWPIAGLWLAWAVTAVDVALTRLSRQEIEGGLLLLAAVLTYLLSHQVFHRDRRWRAPKELCIATLFGAGVALFAAVQSSAAPRQLAVPVVLFMLLCLANCALISTWEQEVDERHGEMSLARQFRGGARFSRALPWIVAAVAPIALAADVHAAGPGVAGCVVASSVLLGAVERAEPRIGRQLARVLADVALMTPCILVAAAWFR